MRMVTHLVFGIGTAVALGGGLPSDVRLTLALVLSVTVNMAIDELGHVTRRGFVSRSPLTHSIFTAPLWGGAIGYLTWIAGTELGFGAGFEWWSILLGVAVAGSHLLLDSLTERGVFVFTNRVALAHFGSRNVLLNGAFILVGLVLLVTWSAG